MMMQDPRWQDQSLARLAAQVEGLVAQQQREIEALKAELDQLRTIEPQGRLLLDTGREMGASDLALTTTGQTCIEKVITVPVGAIIKARCYVMLTISAYTTPCTGIVRIQILGTSNSTADAIVLFHANNNYLNLGGIARFVADQASITVRVVCWKGAAVNTITFAHSYSWLEYEAFF